MEDEDFIDAGIAASDDESEGEDERHEKLLRAVSRPNKNIRASERSEATNVVSEFSLSKRGSENAVELEDLLNPLGKTISLAKIRKTIAKKKQKGKTLVTPLPKQVEQKIARKANYEKACKEVSKWSKIVQQNRNAEQLHFPLKHANIYVDSLPQLVNGIQMKTPLELEIAALLNEKCKVPEGELVDPEKAEAAKWAESAWEDAISARNDMKNNEIRKIRARQSYIEAKNKKQNKIKSKKFHRILKRERLKKEAKELEELQTKNPELVIEKLEGIQKQRAQERMSLRHRNTGKWARNALIRNKMNLDSGRAIQEQIEMSRALTAKHHVESDDEEESVKKTDEKLKIYGVDASNPWFSISTKPTPQTTNKTNLKNIDEEDATPVVDYKKYWNNKNEENKKLDSIKRKAKSEDDMEEDEQDLIDEGMKRVKVLTDMKDVDVVEDKKSKKASLKMISLAEKEAREKAKPKIPEMSEEVDPTKFIEVESRMKKTNTLPDIHMEDDDDAALDDVESSNMVHQRSIVAEAFAEDDLVQQFRDEKEAAVEASKPQELCLLLPGWGDWAGDGIKPSEQKRKRFTFVPAEEKIRKDEKLPHVIINEEGEKPLAPLRVNKVPFPFRNTEEYEQSVKNPVGKHWNPETAFTRLIAPKIVSRRGTIISPMDSDAISKPKSMSKKKMQLKGTRITHNKLRVF